MYDLLDKIYTDIIIQPGKIENEHKAFCDMVDRYTGIQNTLFFLLIEAMSHITILHMYKKKGAFYLFRCKDINSSGILSGLKHKLPATDQFDCNISTMLTRKCTNEVVNHPKFINLFIKKLVLIT